MPVNRATCAMSRSSTLTSSRLEVVASSKPDIESKEDRVAQSQTKANQAQAELWNGGAGRNWVEQNAMLDRLFAPFEQVLVDAVRQAGAREVLDVGCGAGATAFAVAREPGSEGRCTGADLSAPLIDLARRRAAETGPDNADFVVADAQSFTTSRPNASTR
jgi:2-polyprenyl-3-methyl-5-hydroxy-6-metoxy-1,4-benzoquinol methylase